MKIRHISYSGVLSLFPYALLTAPIIGFQFFSNEALEPSRWGRWGSGGPPPVDPAARVLLRLAF